MAQQPPPIEGRGAQRSTPAPSTAGGPPRLPLEPWPPQRRPLRWWFAVPFGLIVYLTLALFTIAQPVSVASLALTVPIPGLPPERLFGLPDRPFTVMIVGLDIRPTQEGPARTDSILLLRIDGDNNRAGVLSIPRDTLMRVSLADGGTVEDRVNTAFVYNWSQDDGSQAPAALAQTIEANLGLRVDYYLVFDQRAAADIVDAAGGVTVVVRQAFGQENYSDDDVNVVPQFFPEGKQHLSGYQAVAYGRIREGSSDFDRIRRQQQVAEGLVAQLSSPANMWRLPGVLSASRRDVETNLSLRQSAGVFVLLKRIGTDRIVTRSLGDAAVSCSRCSGALLQLLPEETARIVSEAFDDDAAGQAASQLLVAAGVAP